MANSLEGRVPFLDHKFVEFALAIPASLKYKNGVTKYILKKACEGILPHDVIYRKKVGFGAPARDWYRTGSYFKPHFPEMLNSSSSLIKDLIDTSYINKLFSLHQKPGHDYSPHLWVFQNMIKSLE